MGASDVDLMSQIMLYVLLCAVLCAQVSLRAVLRYLTLIFLVSFDFDISESNFLKFPQMLWF